jgi:hypothetical protein
MSVKPNAMVEWLTLFLHIQEVPDSNLSVEISNPDRIFRFFLSFSRHMPG